MKNAQIAFHHNQSEATKSHLLDLAKDFSVLTGAPSPNEASKTPELLDYLTHALTLSRGIGSEVQHSELRESMLREGTTQLNYHAQYQHPQRQQYQQQVHEVQQHPH